ncbi:MAG: SUMF1/EgtB/PvdO family nonheme iron enzyme [Capsulimonadaceae bacterium]
MGVSSFRFSSLADILHDRADECTFIVLGEPGSGKTTLLRHLEYTVARNGLTDGRSHLPFFASLAAYRPIDGRLPSPLDWLSGEWRKRLPLLPPLADVLATRPVLFMLDALNEMPHRSADEFREHTDKWRDFVNEEVGPRPGARAVFTCRSTDYSRNLTRGDRDVPQIQVERLDDDRMLQFLRAYLPPGVDAARTFERIQSDAKQVDLFRVPFYLRMLTEQIRQTGELPSDRARLFCGFVREQIRRNSADMLLRPGALLKEEDIEFLNEIDVDRRAPTKLPEHGLLIPSLTRLAVGMLRRDTHVVAGRGNGLRSRSPAGVQRNQIRVPEIEAYELMLLPAETGRDVVRAGCTIAVLGMDRVDRSVMFFHQLLQDFFAARDPSAIAAGLVESGGLEEAVVIATGLASSPDAHIRSVLASDITLAARSAVSAGTDASNALKDDIRAALIGRMQDATLPAKERAKAGVSLSEIGDRRPGVGLRSDGLPDIVWCDVPSGEFLFGSEKRKDPAADSDEQPQRRVSIPAFRISMFPVTYRQYEAFVDAADGYADPRWWKGLHEEGLQQQRGGPGEQAFPFDNHPRERVSWYDAMAFCSWLSNRIGAVITLPTEQQWEKAARGTDGRIYPYGNEFDAAKGNTRMLGIGRTCTVGAFPNGASPYGVQDMSGNVWEWTLTEYESRSDIDTLSSVHRAVRGGATDCDPEHARVAYRGLDMPGYRYGFLGFRLACTADSL